MDYIIIGLLALILIILLVIVFKNNGESNIVEKLGKLETGINKDISSFKYDLIMDFKKDFELLMDKMDRKLNLMDENLNNRINNNFEKTNKTFTDVLTRLTKIDEAQKKIDLLSTDIVSLQSILTDKKTRGIFGEVNLTYILSNVFGENNRKIYELQYQLPNSNVVDAILYAPEPLGTIAIDSKFPLENYQRMTDKSLSKEERLIASKHFEINIKKHIDDIADKYIIKGYTAKEAIMFLPAEAIFAELNAYHSDLITYAYKRKVWITSPTTLMSTLTVIGMILKDMERDKYTKVIHEELGKLNIDFIRYKERWDKLSKTMDTMGKEVKDIHVTTEKITNRFNSINNVDLEIDTYLEHNEDDSTEN